MTRRMPDPLEDMLGELLFRSPDAGEEAFATLLREHPEWGDELQSRWQSFRGPGARVHPDQIGPFRILKLLGQGGMGSVYLAEQLQPVRRRVALKVVKRGLETERVLARFDVERQALALMDHEHIARVFEAGVTDRGQPYFAMEYVGGEPITDFSGRRRLGLRARIRLFQQVCAAVEHAHERGVIHRDLKPSNVLVTERNGSPVPKIIDFGLARATEQQLLGQTLSTLEGQLVGTPEYMAPEQARSDSAGVGVRTDVYALGVLLYEILAGQHPFAAFDLRALDVAEIQRILCHRDPMRPSLAHPALRGDLDWIVLRAMAKEPMRRYATAGELSADLERHLDAQPVTARPPSVSYRVGRFVVRNRVPVFAVGAVLIALALGAYSTLRFALAAARQEASSELLALIALPVRLEMAEQEACAALPAWGESAEDITGWLARWSGLAVHRDELRRLLADRTLEPATRRGLERARDELEQFRGATGWFERMRHSAEWSQQIEALTVRHPHAPSTWEEAAAAIARADGVSASAGYRTMKQPLRPQDGLVPIGCNPATGLWEFYHLRSACDPQRGEDPAALPIPSYREDDEGVFSLELSEDPGIVFVLLPGGESPQGDAVDPFFLARCELTQGQWGRLTDEPHSSWNPWGPRYPVSRVRAEWAQEMLGWYGLSYPRLAQWQYADRGDAQWFRFRPDEATAWEGFANVKDIDARATFPWLAGEFPFSDGHASHAEVASFRPNPFGLHDTAGNVWELVESEQGFHACGGSYSSAPANLRGGVALHVYDYERDQFIGIRPARALR